MAQRDAIAVEIGLLEGLDVLGEAFGVSAPIEVGALDRLSIDEGPEDGNFNAGSRHNLECPVLLVLRITGSETLLLEDARALGVDLIASDRDATSRAAVSCVR